MPLTLDDYKVLEHIGSGSFGRCKKICRKRDNKIHAWKELDYSEMSEDAKRYLITEVNTLRKLRHPYIVAYKGYILNKDNKTLYIVTEYCVGGDLQTVITKKNKACGILEETFIWKILCQILLALWECHDDSVRGAILLHRDIKPANVFLTESMDVKLGDFGLARMLSSTSEHARTFVGTPSYMSPEIINGENYNDKSDIWSLGCLTYELATLSPPFCAGPWPVLAKQISEGRFKPIPEIFSADLDMIIRKMLTVKAEKRPSAEELVNNSVVVAWCNRLDLERDDKKDLERKEKSTKKN